MIDDSISDSIKFLNHAIAHASSMQCICAAQGLEDARRAYAERVAELIKERAKLATRQLGKDNHETNQK